MTTSTLIETAAAPFAPGSLVENESTGYIVLVTDDHAGRHLFSGTLVYATATSAKKLGHHSEGWDKSYFTPTTKGVQLTP